MGMKRLTAGKLAPHFSATDIDGNAVSLRDHTTGYVLLAFLRCTGCPWCNLAVHRLAVESKMLGENNCKVIVFVQSKHDKVHADTHEHTALKPQFPVIADPRKQYYRQYGVNRSFHAVVRAINDLPAWMHAVKDFNFNQGKIDGELFLAQALFLVSCKTQKIVRALYGKSLYDHGTFTPIYQSLIFNE